MSAVKPSILVRFGLGLALAAAVGAEARPGRRVIVQERPAYTHVVVRGSHYYYHDGYFYRHARGRYFLGPAPFGCVVPFLPFGAFRLHAGPVWYFYFGGVYYQQVPAGYVVVPRPETETIVVEPSSSDPAAQAEKPFAEPPADTVMIENSNGSHTPVRLERVDGKWRGPRGELYDALPGDDQLRPVYGF